MAEELVQNQTVSTGEKAKGMSRKTLLLIGVLILVAFSLISIALLPKTKAPEQKPTPTITKVQAQTILTVSSTPVKESTPSGRFRVDVVINTGQNKVTAVQLELSYDPKVLTNLDIDKGAFFDNPNVLLKKIDKENGRITFAIGVPLGGRGIKGQGILAKMTFGLSGPKDETSITFLPKTEVSAEDTPESVLKSTVGSLFEVVQSSSSSPTLFPIGVSSTR